MMTLVLLALGCLLVGCQSDKDKMREFLYRYGNVTIEEAYVAARFKVPSGNIKDLNFKIDSLEVKSVKVKEVNDVKYHFVKAKMMYDFVIYKSNRKLCRWMELTVEEDGFGNMLAVMAKSREVFAAGEDEKDMKNLFKEAYKNGEKMME